VVLEGLFNSEQLGMEAFRLRQVIRNDKPMDYLSEKAFVRKEDIKTMRNFRKNITESS